MSRPWGHLYDTKRWGRLRQRHLAANPFCAYCLKTGIHNDGLRTPEGKPQVNQNKRHLVVDHVKPHRGDLVLFYDADNLQTLCPDHHYADKQQQERRGYSSRVDDTGWPTDPKHPMHHDHKKA